MNIGIGRIAEASAPYREKAKESTTATAIQAAAQEVLAQNPPESAEKIGIIGAYAQGPSDIYRFNGGKLCERGIRGMRPQKAIHSILCEPACQTEITCHIKGFQMSVIGDKLVGIQGLALAADALSDGMAETVLLTEGDMYGDTAQGGAVLLGKTHRQPRCSLSEQASSMTWRRSSR